MAKQLNKLTHSNWGLRETALALFSLLVSFQPALGQTQIEITEGKEQFMSTLASMPYTSSGTGPALYVLEFSECPYCQAFERDWKGQLGGVEMRRFFYGVSDRTSNETAYLAQTRSIDDFHAFMNRTKVAPEFKKNNTAIKAFNSVIGPLSKVLLPIMIKNGWRSRNPVSPQFMWESDGRVYVRGGYTKESANEMLSMVRSGAQVAQVSPPPPAAPEAMGGVGPDVIGLRTGMTPTQTRTIVQSRVLVSAALRKSYAESRGILAFSLPGSAEQRIPNTEFLSTLGSSGRADDGTTHTLQAFFTPVPGREELVLLNRRTEILASKRPTYEAFSRGLLEKYGTPTHAPSPGLHYWSYDRNGTLLQPGSLKNFPTNCVQLSFDDYTGSTPWIMALPSKPHLRQLPSECGAILLFLGTGFQGVSYTGSDTIVSHYSTKLIGLDSAIRASSASGAIIEKARAAASGASIKRAQQQKPDL